jgi:hypothetical protein
MLTPILPYELWVDEAVRGVVRRALQHAAREGIPGTHHFYITFSTFAPGVDLSAELRKRYPSEMTIVLQHQFWDLLVDEDAFAVTLKFQGRQSRLRIPFAAIVAFGDPSVNFGLQLRALTPPPAPPLEAPSDDEERDEPAENKVVTLDTFRKK